MTRALGAAEAAGAALRNIVIRAAATALREFTRVNGAYRDGRFELYSRVNVGIAVTGEAGPSVPTLFDADSMTVAEIAAESRRLEDAARAGSLTAPQLAGGTFTFTDLSATAVTSYEPVIHGGQAGALALGGVADFCRHPGRAGRGGPAGAGGARLRQPDRRRGDRRGVPHPRARAGRGGGRVGGDGEAGERTGDRPPDRIASPRRRALGRGRGLAGRGLGGADRDRRSRPGRSDSARALGCEQTAREGRPGRIGSTLPGFIVTRSVRPAVLALMGAHRFSRYALVFRDQRDAARAGVLTASHARRVPWPAGALYRLPWSVAAGTSSSTRGCCIRSAAGRSGPPAR